MPRISKLFVFLGMVLSFGSSWAQMNLSGPSSPRHLGSPLQQSLAREWNRSHPLVTPFFQPALTAVRPFSEIETTGYVAISGAGDYELPDLRLAIAQNLPADVTLIIYVSDASQVESLKSEYSPYLDSSRLKFLVTPVSASGDPLWARDSLPFPIYQSATPTSSFGLVASIYPQDFDPNAVLQKALGLPMTSTGQYFRGGNLLFDLSGHCFSENVNEIANISNPEAFLMQNFGCQSVTLLDQQGGIGDIDERLKLLANNVALTDNDSYASTLTSKGYKVIRIPQVGVEGETYMNTLYVNGTLFVPQMGVAADAEALSAYQALGFKTVGVMTKRLADEGNGNIHCVTMNYPPGAFVESGRGADFVEFAH